MDDVNKEVINLYKESRELVAYLENKDFGQKQGAIICAVALAAILKANEFTKHGAVSFFIQFLKGFYEEEKV